jgi:protein SCO1/2
MVVSVRLLSVAMLGLALVATPSWADDALEENRAPFSLVDQTGRAVTDQDFLGGFVLIFFGYTSCPDICPTDLTIMSEAVDLLGESGAAVQPIFITIDPERDTVEVMADYVKNFHPRLVGLTGTPEQVNAIGARYGVRAQRYQDQSASATDQMDENYFLDHTGAIYLIAPDGGGLTYFQHGVPAADIAATIQQFIDRNM